MASLETICSLMMYMDFYLVLDVSSFPDAPNNTFWVSELRGRGPVKMTTTFYSVTEPVVLCLADNIFGSVKHPSRSP